MFVVACLFAFDVKFALQICIRRRNITKFSKKFMYCEVQLKQWRSFPCVYMVVSLWIASGASLIIPIKAAWDDEGAQNKILQT